MFAEVIKFDLDASVQCLVAMKFARRRSPSENRSVESDTVSRIQRKESTNQTFARDGIYIPRTNIIFYSECTRSNASGAA